MSKPVDVECRDHKGEVKEVVSEACGVRKYERIGREGTRRK